ncbi:hypothetical protein PsYK624_128320 [Phanerochaete sordida]|uniref:F-box domain-containing protein n=1 Tax=Phanerochaete sordida TaxID=48140 RepID=A0A9P3GK25_9APHY|nr:hypothetical protein PsYK624_128320 [Phanerochaete sordida]
MILCIFQTRDLCSFDGSYVLDTYPGYETDCIAIGHFDEGGDYDLCRHHGRALHPTGDGVVVRRVDPSGDSDAYFRFVVDFKTGVRVVRHEASLCPTVSEHSPLNTWVHVACWAYLQEWLACPLRPRVGRSGTPLSLGGELYEVTASRHQPQERYRGSLPCIDYGGTLDAYMGTRYQDYIVGLRKGVKHIVQALTDGIRGIDLVPAILKDSRFWMWTRPDIWPRAPHTGTQEPCSLLNFSSSAPQPHAAICNLPNELFPELLQHCRLEDVFALSATCKILRLRALDRSTLVHTLRHSMANVSSPLRWTMPVTSLREEWLVACNAMQTWLPAGSLVTPMSNVMGLPTTLPLPPLPLFDPAFPVAAFLHAYRDSDSMRARRRRWELIKQWDVLFANYRRDGWERDVFATPGTTWALSVDGDTGTGPTRIKCQCSQPTEE